MTVRLRGGRIDDLTLSNDFTVLPAIAVGALEQALRGAALHHAALAARLAEGYRALGVQSPGITPDDFAAAILAAANST